MRLCLLRLLFLIHLFTYSTLLQASFDRQKLVSQFDGKSPSVRVRVAKAIDTITISGTDLKRVFHYNQKNKNFLGRKSLRLQCVSQKKLKGAHLLASISSPTGLVTFNQEKFQGKMHVISTPGNKNCDVVNEVGMEEYLSSLLSQEINSKWPEELLKAQAIAARSYAVHKILSKQVSRDHGVHDVFYDLENSEKHQVSGGFFDSTDKTFKAAWETRGEVLLSSKGNLMPIFFHAKCGGKTLKPEGVWSNSVESYKSVNCPYCHDHGKSHWTGSVSLDRFKKFLEWAINYEHDKEIEISDQKVRVFPDKIKKDHIRVYLGETPYSLRKSLLRRYFGRVILRSNRLVLTRKDNKFHFKGKGHGHGVGLCQLGALELASRGWGYKKILSHYFPDHSVTQIYD